MRNSLGDKLRIQHILDAISEVEQYIKEITYEQFLESSENGLQRLNRLRLWEKLVMPFLMN